MLKEEMTVWLLGIIIISYSPYELTAERSTVSCTSHLDCTNISSQSHCENNSCSCDEGYIFRDNGFCMKIFKLHEKCESSENCTYGIKNSYCSSRKVCDCLPGFKTSMPDNSCVQNFFKEVTCTSDFDCHQIIRNARCDDSNFCFCENGLHDEHGCKIFSFNVSSCEDTFECSLALRDGICIDGKCLCPDHFVQLNETFCQQIVLENCSDNATCQVMDPFSFCLENSSCHCLTGYYLSEGGKCTRRRLGDACMANSDCEGVIHQSFCSQETCVCKFGYKRGSTDFRCVQIEIGDTCEHDEECNTTIINSHCHDSMLSCHCNSGFVANDLSLSCDKLKIGRGECKNATECQDAVAYSYCGKESVCQCKSGYAVSLNLDACVRRKIGDRNCKVQRDCSDSIRNGNCSAEGQCVCDVGHYPDEKDPYLCRRRILGDNSLCTDDLDCSSVISDSGCLGRSCRCLLGFTGHEDKHRCRPRILGDECSIEEDCTAMIPSSRCSSEQCSCLSGFAEVSNDTCRKRKIGDQNCLTNSDCYDAIKDSECRNIYFESLTENKAGNYANTCLCKLGFYEQDNGTICILRRIGDSCSNDADCSHAVTFSVCDKRSVNCTCDYDHMVLLPDLSKCVDRPIIDQYKPDKTLKSFRKTYGCGRVFQYHKHTQQCPMAISCPGGGKMRDIYRKQPTCQRANAYTLKFNCTLIVGKYELIPFEYDISYAYNKTSDSYWENALRLSFYGVDQIMLEMNSSSSRPAFHAVSSRYFSSRVLHFEQMRDGVQAIVAIFFRLDRNSSETDMGTIKNMILHFFNRSDGQIGLSKIYIREPYADNFLIEDYDECETNSSYPAVLDSNIERNDCNQNAICANIQGFYQCVCDTSFVDKSEDLEFPGRNCTYKSDALEFELLLSQKECTEENKCETPWSFVIFVTTIIFGLLFLLLAFETVWRMKQMSRSLDEKCRRQTAQLEAKLMMLKEQRRKNISRLLGGSTVIDKYDHQDENTQTESSL